MKEMMHGKYSTEIQKRDDFSLDCEEQPLLPEFPDDARRTGRRRNTVTPPIRTDNNESKTMDAHLPEATR